MLEFFNPRFNLCFACCLIMRISTLMSLIFVILVHIRSFSISEVLFVYTKIKKKEKIKNTVWIQTQLVYIFIHVCLNKIECFTFKIVYFIWVICPFGYLLHCPSYLVDILINDKQCLIVIFGKFRFAYIHLYFEDFSLTDGKLYRNIYFIKFILQKAIRCHSCLKFHKKNTCLRLHLFTVFFIIFFVFILNSISFSKLVFKLRKHCEH